MSRPAVFLDRDGTVIADPGYLGRPEDVRVLPGAARAIARLNRAGWFVAMITNQSGIGRGYYAEDDFRAVQAELERRLAQEGARLDAVEFCPHDPDVHACDCRKPGTALFERVIAAHGIDPARSWFVGDRRRDVAPAAGYGARALLVPRPDGGHDPDAHDPDAPPAPEPRGAFHEAKPAQIERVESLADAVERILDARERPLRVVVLASGSGSNFQALIDRFAADPTVEMAGLVASRAGIGALERAEAAGIPTAVPGPDLAGILRRLDPDLVVLAGWLRLIPPEIVRAWRGRMINIHPSLLPAFGGEGMYGRRVHEAVIAAGVSESGATVHLVDEAYDRGPIVAQRRVPVEDGDDADRLAARVLAQEHRLLPDVVAAVADGSCRLTPEGAEWRHPFAQPGD